MRVKLANDTSGIPFDPQRFDEAVEAWRRRTPMTKDVWEGVLETAKHRAFTVAGVAQVQLVSDVWRALDAAVEKGETFEQFKARVGDKLTSAWGSEQPWRLETIFRTNIQTAYSHGRYAQMTDPVSLQRRPFWKYSAVNDSRTTPICQPLGGTVLPADSPFWNTHCPPLHFNALAASTKVLTAEGEIEIGRIKPGQLVLSHRRRWRRVTAVMHKIVAREALELHLASGRRLVVTDDHPVLVVAATGNLLWRRAGDIQAGDHLFQHLKEVPGLAEIPLPDPENAPTSVDEPGVAPKVVQRSNPGGMALAINLDGNLCVFECEVEHVGSDGELGLDGGPEQVGGEFFRWGEFLPVALGDALAHGLTDGGHAGGVALPHPSGAVGALLAEGPVTFAAALRQGSGVAIGDGDLVDSTSNRHAKALAGGTERGLPESFGALNGADAESAVPVLGADKRLNGGFVGEVQWHADKVTAANRVRFVGELCDLSVEHDESYVAAGVVVHNCRSTIIALSRGAAERQGIADEAPDVEAAEGFGLAPGKGGEVVKPDLSTVPEPLKKALEKKQEARKPEKPTTPATTQAAHQALEKRSRELLGEKLHNPEVVSHLNHELPDALGTRNVITGRIAIRPDVHAHLEDLFRRAAAGDVLLSEDTDAFHVLLHEELHGLGKWKKIAADVPGVASELAIALVNNKLAVALEEGSVELAALLRQRKVGAALGLNLPEGIDFTRRWREGELRAAHGYRIEVGLVETLCRFAAGTAKATPGESGDLDDEGHKMLDGMLYQWHPAERLKTLVENIVQKNTPASDHLRDQRKALLMGMTEVFIRQEFDEEVISRSVWRILKADAAGLQSTARVWAVPMPEGL